MIQKKIHGLVVSELTLGTVQLGINYGLNNMCAPSDQEAAELLEYAFDHDVTCFDTASAYGDAERKIGNWVADYNKSATIITKIHDLDCTSEGALIRSLRKAVVDSKKKLQIDDIPILMIHHFEEYIAFESFFNKAFAVMKEEGHIRLSGVSAYSKDDYYRIADSSLDAVQIPVNILDWKQIINGGIKAMADAGMIVFARSVFLQGLLLRSKEQLPSSMKFAESTLSRFADLCSRWKMTQQEAALSFVMSIEPVTSIVIGCRNKEQLADNLKLYNRIRRLNKDQITEAKELFYNIEERVFLPMLWNK